MKTFLKVLVFIIAALLLTQCERFGEDETDPSILEYIPDIIANGRNFDAAVANDKIYLISDNYYELDLEGNIIYTNENVNDIKQGVFDFHPAVDVGSDTVVHVIHRRGDKTIGVGFELNYSKREAGGTWSIVNQVVGSEQPRNYVVDVVAMDGGEAVYAHTMLTTDDVEGQVFFYKLYDGKVDPWGSFGDDNYYRVDADFRMVRYGNTLHLATGQPDPTGTVFYMHAPINSSLPTALASSADQFLTGGARAGMPDIKVDNNGRVFITSGDGDREEVVFERFSNTGTNQVSNKILLDGLGGWHLDLGMSAMATSTTGDTILVVGLETGGDAESASNSSLRYTYSFDAGDSWSSYAIPTRRTHACEGRNRPRIHFYNSRFYVFYNNVDGGISMIKFQLVDGP